MTDRKWIPRQEPRPALLNLPALPPGPGERRRILVVDDEPGMRYMARRVLERKFEVREAETGEEALQILEAESFHIAVVDVRLPGISGLDLLSAMKTCCPSIDVIVMTGSALDIDEALESAIRRKAFFFLRKPFPMTILETLADRVAETQGLEERLVAYARTLERNLESARIFQRRLLPPLSWEGPRTRIAAAYHSCERLSGDFFDYWDLPGDGTAVLIADVMGHGPSAAMVTGIVKSQVRRLALEHHEPGEVLDALDEELGRIALPSFLTAFLLFDRPRDGEIAWAGAGHPPAFLWGPDARLEPLVSAQPPVNTGIAIGPRESAISARRKGTRVLLYTDGYPEGLAPDGTPFDGNPTDPTQPPDPATPFGQAVRTALATGGPADGIRTLDAAWSAHVRERESEDDRAVVLVELR